MILVDTNLLVHASIEELPQHAPAREWLDERLAGVARVGLPWPSLLGFLRLVSQRRLFERPVSLRQAWGQVEGWLTCAPVWVPLPTERHAEVLGSLLEGEARSNLVPDAHLAALAIEHGLTLCSTDRDFARFRGLRWEDPLSVR